MHRSRVGVVLIDHPESSYADAAAFWSAAVGRERVAEEGPYESLGSLAGGLELALQRLGGTTQARIHLDIDRRPSTATPRPGSDTEYRRAPARSASE